jgi:predicted ATPase
MLAASPASAADVEQIYLLGIDFARKAGAQMFELRLAIRLSRLWLSQNKRDQARTLLSEIYNKFDEGFTTTDLVTAQKLLQEMS